MTFKDSFQQFVEFTDSCIYTTKDPGNQLDINKLFGLSEGVDPHKNSSRFGWRCLGTDKIEIFAYCYNNGVRSSQKITEVFLYSRYYFSLRLVDNQYIFSVNGATVVLPRSKGFGLKYKLWPYMGGTEPAQHDTIIDIS